MKQQALIFLLAVALAPASYSSSITVEFKVNITQYYNYPTASYISIAPITGSGSITFETDPVTYVDYGQTTITNFGDVLGTIWESPVTALVPIDPYTGAYGKITNSYTYPNTNDYPSVFIVDAASQATTYKYGDGNYATYHIAFRAERRSPPRNGDGTSDYVLTRQELLNHYRSFQSSGESVFFNESYAVYTFADGQPVYTDGKDWTSYSAQITNVIDHAAVVPEPDSWKLFAGGLILFVLTRRRGPKFNQAPMD